jgi:hypothetical protein
VDVSIGLGKALPAMTPPIDGGSFTMGEYCEIDVAPLKAPVGGASSGAGGCARFSWPIVGEASRNRNADGGGLGEVEGREPGPGP